MSLPVTLIIIGIVFLILSLFAGTKQSSKDEIETISISLHQETSHLKKRVRALEEELMMEPTSAPHTERIAETEKPVHTIIVSQIMALHGQGYSIEEISKRSSLSTNQVRNVLRSKGVQV